VTRADGVVTIVQARTGSTRLPGKVLFPLGGATVLERQLERLGQARRTGLLVVATTTDARDDAIESIARRTGALCYRGDPLDLLDRHYQAARALGAAHVVKIPSDCPLIDPAVVDRVIGTYLDSGGFAYCSNLHPATYPDGQDVEVFGFPALASAWREAVDRAEREHTTPFLWRRPERFRLGNVTWETGADCSATHRVVLDYLEDYAVIRSTYEALAPQGGFGVQDVVDFLDAHPDVAALNAARRGDCWQTRADREASRAIGVEAA